MIEPTLLTDAQQAYLRQWPPGNAVADALTDLLTQDTHLFEVDANERSITFRFAMFLQQRLPEWAVDCEFNRDGIDPKKIGYLDIHPDNEDAEAKTVFPDVIAHKRGSKENYLVLEFKKSSSKVDEQVDQQKLHGYKQQLGYAYALFVRVGTDGQASVRDLEWI